MHMDQYSGELLATVGWKDYGLVPKAAEMAVNSDVRIHLHTAICCFISYPGSQAIFQLI